MGKPINNPQMSFSEFYVERRTRKGTFLRQIDDIIDWSPIEKEINKVRPLQNY